MSTFTDLKSQLIKSLGGALPVDISEAVSEVDKRYQTLLQEQFSVYDAQLQSLKLALQQWEDLGSIDQNRTRDLERLAQDAETLFRFAPEARNAVKYYTSMAVGTSLSIKIRTRELKLSNEIDPAQALFDQVFGDENNEPAFSTEARQNLSDELLVKARVVYAFFPDGNGKIKCRTLDNPFEIVQVITNPEDKTDVWFYKRTWKATNGTPQTLYYRHWRLKDAPVRIQNERGQLEVYQSQADYLKLKVDTQARIAYAGYSDEAAPAYMVMLEFGPFFEAAIDWVRQQARFMEDRATIVRNRATYLDEYTVDGGSRAVSAIQAKLNSTLQAFGNTNWERNPSPSAGSSMVHNKAIDSKQRSVATGADDAEKDGRLFRSMPAAAFGIPAALLYMDAEASGNLNAIIELMKRAQGLWESYRSIWHGFYKRLVKFILEINEYNGIVTIDVDAPPMIEVNLPEFTRAVIDGEGAGLIPKTEAARLYLLRLGSNNVDELISQIAQEQKEKQKRAELMQKQINQGHQQPPQPAQEMSAEDYAKIIQSVLKDLREND